MPKLSEKLTDRVIRNLPVPEKGNELWYDPELKGFACRVTCNDARSFVLVYHFAGKERRDTIGQFPDWSAKAARTVAADWRSDVRRKIDPRGEPEPQSAEEATFKARAEAFLEHGRRKRGLPLRPATKREYRRALMVYAATLHSRPLADVKRGEIATVIQRVARDRGDVSAKNCRAALSRLYSWAIANGHVESNPATGTETYDTPKRKRVLSDDELCLIWRATDKMEAFPLIVRMCMWTGTRRGEPGGMLASEIEHTVTETVENGSVVTLFNGDVWKIPGARTKNHRDLWLPLPRQARTALAAWREHRGADEDVLFGRGLSGFSGWSASKRRLDARIAELNAEHRLCRKLAKGERPLPSDAVDWDLHDVRRTVETRLARLRVLKEIANRVLNHAQGPITETYDQHDYLREKSEALQAWADTLERIVGEAPSNVAPMRRSAS
jgi:integrase